jgi:hypothetical protein
MTRTFSLGWREADFSIAGEEIVAIGDVHGQAELLGALLEEIERRALPGSPMVFLGDLIDRGPDSRGCLRLAAQAACRRPVHWLMGNHEAMFLAWLDAWDDIAPRDLHRWGTLWLENGGASVLAEFGRDSNAERGRALRAEMSPEEMRVLDGLGIFHRSGETIFIHGGLAARCLRQSDEGHVLDEREFAAFLITSAPASARSSVAIGPGSRAEKSRTRRPSSGLIAGPSDVR